MALNALTGELPIEDDDEASDRDLAGRAFDDAESVAEAMRNAAHGLN